ncbi:MAG: hypothetical protein AAFZ15_32645 [Bacteroidota bacterium]
MDQINKELLDKSFVENLARNKAIIRDEVTSELSKSPYAANSPEEFNRKVEEGINRKMKEEQVVEKIESKVYGTSGYNKLTNELYQAELKEALRGRLREEIRNRANKSNSKERNR